MNPETTFVPDIHPGYPSQGRRLGPAWSDIWHTLAKADDYLDSRVLSAEVAERHGLQASTLLGILSRAFAADLLERTHREVQGNAGRRTRVFYRIKG